MKLPRPVQGNGSRAEVPNHQRGHGWNLGLYPTAIPKPEENENCDAETSYHGTVLLFQGGSRCTHYTAFPTLLRIISIQSINGIHQARCAAGTGDSNSAGFDFVPLRSGTALSSQRSR